MLPMCFKFSIMFTLMQIHTYQSKTMQIHTYSKKINHYNQTMVFMSKNCTFQMTYFWKPLLYEAISMNY